MSENLYQAPESEDSLLLAKGDPSLNGVARLQRALIIAIILYCLSFGAAVGLSYCGEVLAQVGLILVVSVFVIGVITVARLAFILYGTVMSILLIFLVMIPLIGLLVLLRVNARATETLRKAGYEVGFFGAKNYTE